jgi:hypothetical protein
MTPYLVTSFVPSEGIVTLQFFIELQLREGWHRDLHLQ